MNILDAVDDPHLFRPWFKDPDSWKAWRAFLASLFALPMTPDQLATYQQCTGRSAPPTAPASEAWLVCGRRAGKSFVLALTAVYLAAFHEYHKYLAPGERGNVMIIATDRKQSRVILRYIRGLLTRVPMLARMIDRETAEGFDLTNGVTIEVGTASYKSVRGYTIVAALCDELAFWPTEDSAQPDYEILDALRPGMATIPGGMLLCASSPYARRGALWDAHRRHYAKDDDPVLVWQADTRTMNSTVPARVVAEAMERDPANAAAEYGAQFRTDLEAFVSREAVEACIDAGVYERMPQPGIRYACFVDPAGGSGKDSFTMAIGHAVDDVAVADCVREVRPPFSPEGTIEELCVVAKSYGITSVTGDNYAGDFPAEQFRKRGPDYLKSDKVRSDLYRDFLPVINSKRLKLLDHQKANNQICGLERSTGRGKDNIDHPRGAQFHDDIANAIAGLVNILMNDALGYDDTMAWVCGPDDEIPADHTPGIRRDLNLFSHRRSAYR